MIENETGGGHVYAAAGVKDMGCFKSPTINWSLAQEIHSVLGSPKESNAHVTH